MKKYISGLPSNLYTPSLNNHLKYFFKNYNDENIMRQYGLDEYTEHLRNRYQSDTKSFINDYIQIVQDKDWFLHIKKGFPIGCTPG